MWALSPNMPFTPPLVAGAGGFFAPYCRAYIARTGAPPHIGPMIAANARDNAGRNEYAHLREPMTVEDVMNSPMLWDPIRYLETCPSSDGAIALVRRERGAREEGAAQARVGQGRRVVRRGDVGAGPRPGEPARPGSVCAKHVYDAGRHHRSVEADRHRRDLRAVRLVRGDVAREPRLLRRSARAGRSSTAASRSSARTCRSTRRAACCAPTRSAPPACCASARPRCR